METAIEEGEPNCREVQQDSYSYGGTATFNQG
ncbi:hypothetical protein C5167_050728 [Papaver somniferum]|uniref:Uncharacterized protein n=1 Tax=Papaver somniferum TaxID=3469 RepID=A0A4Y7KT07_PAPSO|nr:hypothetical protein C5167_050728 [Papaver somniferum]